MLSLAALFGSVCWAAAASLAPHRQSIILLIYAFGADLSGLELFDLKHPGFDDFGQFSKAPTWKDDDERIERFFKHELPWMQSEEGQRANLLALQIRDRLGRVYQHTMPIFRLLLLYHFDLISIDKLNKISTMASPAPLVEVVRLIQGSLIWREVCPALYASMIKALVRFMLERLSPAYYVNLPKATLAGRSFLKLKLGDQGWRHTSWSLVGLEGREWKTIASGKPRRNDLVREFVVWLFNFNQHGHHGCPPYLRKDPFGAASLIMHRIDSGPGQESINSLIQMGMESPDPEHTRVMIGIQLLRNIDSNILTALRSVLVNDTQVLHLYRLVISWTEWPNDLVEARLLLLRKLIAAHFKLPMPAMLDSVLAAWKEGFPVYQALENVDRALLAGIATEEQVSVLKSSLSAYSIDNLVSVLQEAIEGRSFTLQAAVLDEASVIVEAARAKERLLHDLCVVAKIQQITGQKIQHPELLTDNKIAWFLQQGDELTSEVAPIRKSTFLKRIHPDLLVTPKIRSDSNHAQLVGNEGDLIIKTLAYLEGLIDRRQLLMDLEFKFKMDASAVMAWFGDAILPWLKVYKNEFKGGHPIAPDRIILAALWQLKTKRPEFCPLDPTEIDDLLEMFLIHMTASFFLPKLDSINELIISRMKIGDRVILPGTTGDHSIAVDIQRRREQDYLVTILNSGEGMSSHDQLNQTHRLYYRQYEMSWEDLQVCHFFVVNLAGRKVVSNLFLGPPSKKIDLSSKLLTDSVSGQKTSICFSRSARYALKFYLGAARYNWIKTLILLRREDEIKSSLGERTAWFDSYDKLQINWPTECDFKPTNNLWLPILRHAVLRYLGEAKKNDGELGADMIRMLNLIEKDPSLELCFEESLGQ